MQVRKTAIIALSAITLLVMASCGGGGSALNVLSAIPKGDYFALQGFNPAAKYDAPIFKQLADESDSVEKEFDNWEDRLDDMEVDNVKSNNLSLSVRSEEAVENIGFEAGRFEEDQLEDYFEDEQRWEDWDDDESEGMTYYTGKRNGTEFAILLHNGGMYLSQTDTIEDVIDVIKKGDSRITEIDEFKEFQKLVDFNATEFEYQWDNMDGVIATYKNYLRQIGEEDNDDSMDAIEDLDAQGISVYWGNTLRVVYKLQFGSDKDLDALVEVLEDEMDEILEKLGTGMVNQLFAEDADPGNLDDLADKIRVRRSGMMIEITAEFTWEDIETLID